jgi:hypothetical protein
VDVEPKNVVAFKPGKEMEERVRKMPLVEEMEEDETEELEESLTGPTAANPVATKAPRTRKMT